MKRVIVCDSGLGGLNIASHFFQHPGAEPCELLYFNAYPAWGHGFNTLPDERAKEELFQTVLESMKKFSPDLCFIACNTLSIVYESLKKRYTPGFPVRVILDAAVDMMSDALQRGTAAKVLILGTKTTVESGLYRERLLRRGIAPERICALACPGLATALEIDPAAPEVSRRIGQYADEALTLFERPPEKLLLALCCTHFEFAGTVWHDAFAARFKTPVAVINPNEGMKGDFYVRQFRCLSRIGFAPGARERMSHYFETHVPEIASALSAAKPDPSLFAFKEEDQFPG